MYHVDEEWALSMYYNILYYGEAYSLAAHNNMSLGASWIASVLYEGIPYIFSDNMIAYRYVSVALGLITMFVIYKLVEFHSKNELLAIRSTALIGITESFVFASHIPRTEILVLCLFVVGLYLHSRTDFRFNFIYSGLIGFLSVEAHLNGLFYLFLVAGFEISKMPFTKNRLKDLIHFFIGGLIALALILLSKAMFYEDILNSQASMHIGLLSIPERIIWYWEMVKDSKYYRSIYYLFFVVVTFMLMYINNDNINKFQKTFLSLFLSGIFGFYVLGRLNPYYLVLMFPFLWILFSELTLNKSYIYFAAIAYFVVFWSAVLYKDGNISSQINYLEKVKVASSDCLSSSTIVIAPIQLWKVFRDHKFYAYRSQFDKLFRTQFEGNGGLFVKDELLFVANQQMIDWLHDGKITDTAIKKFKMNHINKLELIGSINDYHYGGGGATKNNTVKLYCRTGFKETNN